MRTITHATPGAFSKDVMAPAEGYRLVSAYFGHEEYPQTDFSPRGWMSIYNDTGVRFFYGTAAAGDYVILEAIFERSDEVDLVISTSEAEA
jgi:hypothetical protein